MANKCYGCGSDLTNKRKRFDWLVSRGYIPKDAAAQVLNNAGGLVPPNACCVVGLETNLDPTKDIRERNAMKDIIAKENAATQMQLTGINPLEREEVYIFSTNLQGDVMGSFRLEDFPEGVDASVLGGQVDASGVRSPGFPITNIAKIPEKLGKSTSYGWGDVRPLALWSGKIKIIPVVIVDGRLTPGYLRVQKVNNTADTRLMTDVIDKTLLQGEIIAYKDHLVPGSLTTTGHTYITLRKQLGANIIA